MARLKATTTCQVNSSYVRITRSKTVKISRKAGTPPRTSHHSRHRGTRALKEIRRYQKGTKLLLPKLPFCRLARDIAEDITFGPGTRFAAEALESLQVAAESALVRLFEDAVLVMVNARRVTLMVKDLEVVRRIRGI